MKDPDTTELGSFLDEILQTAHEHILYDPKCEVCHQLFEVKGKLLTLITKREAEAYRAGQIDILATRIMKLPVYTIDEHKPIFAIGTRRILKVLAELQSDNGEEGK